MSTVPVEFLIKKLEQKVLSLEKRILLLENKLNTKQTKKKEEVFSKIHLKYFKKRK
jgi:hypothetical protein